MLSGAPKFREQSRFNIEAERLLIRQKQVQERREEWRGKGKEFERHICGAMARRDAGYFVMENKILGSSKRLGARVGERQIKALLDLIKKYQEGSPINPVSDYARNLRSAIAEELGLAGEESEKNLKFYTAIAGEGEVTAVDFKLGADAWLEYKAGERVYDMRFDATTNPDNPSKDIVNSDIIIGPEHAPNAEREPEAYMKEIKKMAEAIALKFAKKIERDEYLTVKIESPTEKKPLFSRLMRGDSSIREYVPPPKRKRR